MTTKEITSWVITCDHAGTGGLCKAHEARDHARNEHGWQYRRPDIDLCRQHSRKD